MKWGRELALLLVVAVAGTAWYFSMKHEQRTAEAADELVFPGFDAARVRCILAEDTKWDWHMRLERDDHGGWKMIDPIAVPARLGLVEHLLEAALRAHGPQVPASEIDPAQLGFMPPRVVLEIEEVLDGKSRHERVEIGGLDADGRRVNVRVRGHYLRVGRELDTAIDRQLEDFKTDIALEFNVTDVVHVRRSGRMVQPNETADSDIALDLELGQEGWRSVAPGTQGITLDPTLVGTWIQGLASIHHSGYFDELGGRLDAMGLDPPEVRLELELRDGTKHALRLGRPGHTEGQVWYTLRESLGIVWALEQDRVYLVGWPLEGLVNPRILRARREDVTAITLDSGGGSLYMTHDGKAWHLAQRRPGEKSLDKAVWAEPAKVEELLGALEKVELVEFRFGQTVPEAPEAPAVWIDVGGERQGGWFGAAAKNKNGEECVLFQRRGENACSLAPKSLLDAVEKPFDEFWSMKLVDIQEHGQATLSILCGEKERQYDHNSAGKWRRADTQAEAKELYDVLDSLCFLRASKHLPLRTVEDAGWEQTMRVMFKDPLQIQKVIWLGVSRETKEVEVIYDGQRGVAKDQGLHARLLKILDGP